MKHEANITPRIEKYISLKKIYGHIEIKSTLTNRFNLSNFEPQQLPGLLAAEKSGLVIKWSDADLRLKTCDIISTPPGLSSYVAIKYPKCVFFILAFKIVECKKTMKSLSLEKAREISMYEVKL